MVDSDRSSPQGDQKIEVDDNKSLRSDLNIIKEKRMRTSPRSVQNKNTISNNLLGNVLKSNAYKEINEEIKQDNSDLYSPKSPGSVRNYKLARDQLLSDRHFEKVDAKPASDCLLVSYQFGKLFLQLEFNLTSDEACTESQAIELL